NNQIKSGIIRFDFHDGRSGELLRSKEVSLAAAGNNPGQRTIHHAVGFQVSFTDDCFYSPALMQIEPVKKVYGISGDVLGRAYAVGPTSVPLARSITVSFDLENETDKSRLGLYRLNDKNKWKWVDSEISQNIISAESDFVGTFAVIEDTKSPRVKKIYPPKGKTVKTALPKISCTIEDNLSGIKDDGNVTVLLDGQWLIPEYDPETKRLETYPRSALANGQHDLVIKFSDRAGNERSVFSYFFVKER
ncbi:MAG: hypothetical protein JSU69_02890, partial [Candidatus Zixiibacteriota bacterium]